MIVPYREPVLTVKILATFDVLSEGRLTEGVGVDQLEEEFNALGTPPFRRQGTVINKYTWVKDWTRKKNLATMLATNPGWGELASGWHQD